MRAIRFHYRPVRYLLTRWASSRRPEFSLSRAGCVSLDEVEPPALPGPEWVRVRTTLSGVCGSDLAALTAHDSFTLEPFGAYPFTFGHENVGVIAETGPGAGGWEAGERVIVHPMISCLQRGIAPVCAACARGDDGLCRHTRDGVAGPGPMIGYNPAAGGGWSVSFVAHRSRLYRAGELPDELAVLADPLASALRPVLLQPPAEGDVVLVIGAGTIGAFTVASLRAVGWRGTVAVLARHGFQKELAERAGADVVLGGRREAYDWAARLPGAVAYNPKLAPRFVEGGPSLVFDTVGSERTVADTLALTREAGRVVLVGSAARLRADWTRVWYRQLSVAGIFAYGRVPDGDGGRDIYDAAIELLRKDGIAELGMVTHVYDLEEYRAGLSAALDKKGQRSIKVAFRPAG